MSRGRIEVICGCMFSDKSERLVARLVEARLRGQSAVAFKHATDDRYARDEIVTHNGRRAEAIPVASAQRILELAGDAQLIIIDEAQFFGDDLVEACQTLVERGHEVVLAGLDLDSWGLPFGPVPALAAIADQVIRTYAVCAKCGARADHTQRRVPNETRKMIGGRESYEPRCAHCFEPPPIHWRR